MLLEYETSVLPLSLQKRNLWDGWDLNPRCLLSENLVKSQLPSTLLGAPSREGIWSPSPVTRRLGWKDSNLREMLASKASVLSHLTTPHQSTDPTPPHEEGRRRDQDCRSVRGVRPVRVCTQSGIVRTRAAGFRGSRIIVSGAYSRTRRASIASRVLAENFPQTSM